jgi:hypothetical protein
MSSSAYVVPHRALVTLVAAVLLSSGPVFAAVQFVDVAASVGLNFTQTGTQTFPEIEIEVLQLMFTNMGAGAAVGDYDDDGDLDVYVLGQYGQANRLYRNDLDLGSKQFTDVTPVVLADTGSARVAHFVDLDRDGDLDLLLINDDDGLPSPASRSRIFRNDGGGAFSDVSAASGFRPLGWIKGGAAIADYDGDGFLDIYVTNWGAESGGGNPVFPGSNRLYRNLGGLQFEDVTVAAGLGTLARDSFTAVFVDLDEDGDPDLYVAVDHSSDEFFRNDDGSFTLDTTNVGTTHVGNDMGVAPGDFDGDSDIDLYVTNITDPDGNFGTGQGNVLYENRLVPDGGLGVIISTPAAALDTYWGWGTEFLDADNDGDLDLAAATGFDEFVEFSVGQQSAIYQTSSVLLINDGVGTFSRLLGTGLDATDDSRGMVAFDYDRDGDLDILITNRNQPVRLFENQSTGLGNWLTVRLGRDAQAIGAVVYATTGGVTRRRDIIAGHSYLVGTPSEVHFGLGTDTQVDTLEIVWANGDVEHYSNLVANQIVSYEWAPPASVPALAPPYTIVLGLVLAAVGALAATRHRI